MADKAIESALLQSLPGARRYVRAEGPAQRNDCHDTNSQAENQNSKGRGPQPAITSRHVDREKTMHPVVDLERCNNNKHENDLRSAILYLALAPACLGEDDEEDLSHPPYACQCIEKEFD